MDSLKYAIIGCGLIGTKRAKSFKPGQLKYVCDVFKEKSKQLASAFSDVTVTEELNLILSDSSVNAVIISTSNDQLFPVAKRALESGKNILIEKPAGTKSSQILELIELANQNKCIARVGFNHRYHPAFLKAREIFEQGFLGPLMFIRGRYGHGGRIGYEKEWRADPKLSGGGELIDQGVHLIDLSSWFLGTFSEIEGHATNYFWDMPVDDNAFLNLRNIEGKTAFLSVSCTEWKNLFSFEIYGRNAKLHIEGLGSSYGVEKLYYYKMLPEMGPPETTIYEYPRGDSSWEMELSDFEKDVSDGKKRGADLQDAYQALKVVETVYQKSVYNF